MSGRRHEYPSIERHRICLCCGRIDDIRQKQVFRLSPVCMTCSCWLRRTVPKEEFERIRAQEPIVFHTGRECPVCGKTNTGYGKTCRRCAAYQGKRKRYIPEEIINLQEDLFSWIDIGKGSDEGDCA